MDSVGLGILVGAAKRAAERQGGLSAVSPPPNVLRVFEVSGTRDLLKVAGALPEARARLGCSEVTDGGGE